MRIALDAMGSDAAPGPELDAALAFVRSSEHHVLLVGPAARLGAALAVRGDGGAAIEIVDAASVIDNHDAPAHAVRAQVGSSLCVAAELCRQGRADALVSAGPSGAVLAASVLLLGTIAGIDRPAIVATLPARHGGRVLLTDAGANVDCRPQHLVGFAQLGAAYIAALGGERRRVALLSNGAETEKGNALTRAAHERLRALASPPFLYLGPVEGHRIFSGEVDVVVCDGFVGNTVLKASEGVVELIGADGAAYDWAAAGGAPLVGCRSVVMVCHGRSPASALTAALGRAATLAAADLPAHVAAFVTPGGQA